MGLQRAGRDWATNSCKAASNYVGNVFSNCFPHISTVDVATVCMGALRLLLVFCVHSPALMCSSFQPSRCQSSSEDCPQATAAPLPTDTELEGPGSLWFPFPGGSDGKVSAYNAGDLGSIPGSGRSPGEGNGTPLQYSCLENPMDGWTW